MNNLEEGQFVGLQPAKYSRQPTQHPPSPTHPPLDTVRIICFLFSILPVTVICDRYGFYATSRPPNPAHPPARRESVRKCGLGNTELDALVSVSILYVLVSGPGQPREHSGLHHHVLRAVCH